jgi:seryl-tRNA synthetase
VSLASDTRDPAAFLHALVEHGLLVPGGAPGVVGRGAAFEDLRRRFDDAVTRAAAADAAEPLRFPPVLPRRYVEDTGYLHSFPHLLGSVFAFEGGDAQGAEMAEMADRGEDWTAMQQPSDLVLTPAVCYPVYPAIAARGPLPPGGLTVDPGGAYAFRHEPSSDPTRLRMFHMRELVRIGAPEDVAAWRDGWCDRALELLGGLGLDARLEVAADPFFGRAGRMLARTQREQELKLEIVVQIAGPQPTAVASLNLHRDHFAAAHGLVLSDGGTAHTACLGFGHERIVLALLRTHGLDTGRWPDATRRALELA